MRTRRASVLLMLFFLSSFSLMHSQSISSDLRIQLPQAMNLERAGKWAEALEVYLSLERMQPYHPSVLNGLQRCYQGLGSDDKFLVMMEKKYGEMPADYNVLKNYVSALFSNNDKQRAISVLNAYLDLTPKNKNSYGTVASLYFANRLLEEAEQVYLRGRQKLSDKDLFSNELASLYFAQFRFPESVQEYLRFLSTSNNQVRYVERQLIAIQEKWNEEKAVVNIVDDYVKKHSVPSIYYKLLSDLYFSEAEFDKSLLSLDHYVAHLDQDEQRAELENFIRQSEARGGLAAAKRAYSMLELLGSVPKLKLSFDKARLATLSGDYQSARDTYLGILELKPEKSVVVEVYEMLGELYLRYLDDPESAINWFRKMERLGIGIRKYNEIELRIAESYVLQDHESKARSIYESLYKDQQKDSEILGLALFELSNLELYGGRVEEAAKGYEKVVGIDPKLDFVNDALEWVRIIREDDSADKVLSKKIGRVAYYNRLNHYKEALKLVQEVIRDYPKSKLIPDVNFRMAEIFKSLNDFPQALASYGNIIDSYPGHRLAPFAEVEIGIIFLEHLSDSEKAKKHFERVILNYPENLVTADAREFLAGLE